jgi:hypothetical protein
VFALALSLCTLASSLLILIIVDMSADVISGYL